MNGENNTTSTHATAAQKKRWFKEKCDELRPQVEFAELQARLAIANMQQIQAMNYLANFEMSQQKAQAEHQAEQDRVNAQSNQDTEAGINTTDADGSTEAKVVELNPVA